MLHMKVTATFYAVQQYLHLISISVRACGYLHCSVATFFKSRDYKVLEGFG